jgi:tight adherence protein B
MTFKIGPSACDRLWVASGLLLPHAYVGFRRGRRFKKFTDEFPNSVDIIVRGVKSGLPLVDCLRIISVELRIPSGASSVKSSKIRPSGCRSTRLSNA